MTAQINSQTPALPQLEPALEAHFRQLLSAGGYPEADQTTLADLAIRVANVRFRTIPPGPRRIETPSITFDVPVEVVPGFERLVQAIEQGVDLTPFQSKTRLKPDFHDDLLTDWGIHHFHLGAGDDAKHPNFVERTGPVLYAAVGDEAVYMITIDQHGRWSDPQLLETLRTAWPELFGLTHQELQVAHPLTNEADIAAFRKAGINGAVRLGDGSIHFGNRALDGTPIDVMLRSSRLVAQIRDLQRYVDQEFSGFTAEVAKFGVPVCEQSYLVQIRAPNDRMSSDILVVEQRAGYEFKLATIPW